MEILETHVTPPQDGACEYTVEFVYGGGRRVSVILEDDNSSGYDEQSLIAKAKSLLDEVDDSGVRGDLPDYEAHQNDVSENKSGNNPPEFHPDQPEGPMPPANPLIDAEDDPDAQIIPVKNEGMIEP
jgi:hypothetical protein